MGRRFEEVSQEIAEVPYSVTKGSRDQAVVEVEGKEYTPPERLAISIATCHISSTQPAWGPCVLILVACRSPRLMPPCVGFRATLPQKAAGRMIEPPTCVPNAVGTIREATAAAEPEEEPPGVRDGSNGLVVAPGCDPPSSAVTVLPRTTAPAARSAHTAALSFVGKLPA